MARKIKPISTELSETIKAIIKKQKEGEDIIHTLCGIPKELLNRQSPLKESKIKRRLKWN